MRTLLLRSIALATSVVAAVAATCPLVAEESALLPKSRVAIVGDSITEQKLYSKYVESWLLACSGVPDLRVMQFGWGGETAGGFANRADNDLGIFDPDIVTLCYGMNDGGYQPWKGEIGDAFYIIQSGRVKCTATKVAQPPPRPPRNSNHQPHLLG